MTKNRLEAFSDGVIAIIITIMVLELKVPHDPTWHALQQLFPIFLSYLLSFVYVAIYWNNHHHLLHAAHKIDAAVLWANMHLLFWLSLIPFVTGWMGENHFESLPVALYGFVLLMCAVSYYILSRVLVRLHGQDSHLAKAMGSDTKGRISLALYIIGLASAYWLPWLGGIIYIAVAIMWLIPDRRITRTLEGHQA
jgi:uncharacterized membrane protein